MVDRPIVLVLGSEGTGLRISVKQVCTGFVIITSGTSNHQLGNVDSLNVSVAARILMHQLLISNQKYHLLKM